MRETKECVECGGIYFRGEHVTQGQWEVRRYCSPRCAGLAQMRTLQARKAQDGVEAFRQKTFEGKALCDEETLHAKRVASEIEDQSASMPMEPKARVMRDLRIVRVGPNPRLVVCEYFELAQRRTCTVLVKRTQKYVRGMRFRMPEPVSESEFRRPWVYSGPAPRHRGRW